MLSQVKQQNFEVEIKKEKKVGERETEEFVERACRLYFDVPIRP